MTDFKYDIKIRKLKAMVFVLRSLKQNCTIVSAENKAERKPS